MWPWYSDGGVMVEVVRLSGITGKQMNGVLHCVPESLVRIAVRTPQPAPRIAYLNNNPFLLTRVRYKQFTRKRTGSGTDG